MQVEVIPAAGIAVLLTRQHMQRFRMLQSHPSILPQRSILCQQSLCAEIRRRLGICSGEEVRRFILVIRPTRIARKSEALRIYSPICPD